MTALRQPVTRLRRNMRPVAFGALPLALAVVAAAVPSLTLVVPILLVWGVVGVVGAWRRDRAPREQRGELVIDDASVRFGAETAALRDVRSATWRHDERLGPVVELDVEWPRRWRFAAESPAAARDLVAAAGADPRRRRARFHALSRSTPRRGTIPRVSCPSGGDLGHGAWRGSGPGNFGRPWPATRGRGSGPGNFTRRRARSVRARFRSSELHALRSGADSRRRGIELQPLALRCDGERRAT